MDGVGKGYLIIPGGGGNQPNQVSPGAPDAPGAKPDSETGGGGEPKDAAGISREAKDDSKPRKGDGRVSGILNTISEAKNEAPGDTGKKKKLKPDEVMLKYVCSKGDVEYHKANESRSGVQAHEERHIADYNAYAKTNDLKVKDPGITINEEYNEDLGQSVATGGQAKCHYVAELDGVESEVSAGKDGSIADPGIAKKIDDNKRKKQALM
jgi:hypothetical protein